MSTATKHKCSQPVRVIVKCNNAVFIAKDEYVYTRITTITPLYIFVNHTDKVIIVSQYDTKELPFVINKGDRLPFHWANKDLNKIVCIKSMNDSLSSDRRD